MDFTVHSGNIKLIVIRSFLLYHQLINNLFTFSTSLVEVHFTIIMISKKYYLDSGVCFYSKLAGPTLSHTSVKP